MRDMRPRTLLALSLVFGAATVSAAAQASEHAKILDIQSAIRAGNPIAVDAAPNVPIIIPSSSSVFMLTVQIDDIVYSAEFGQGRKLRSSDFIVGDTANVTIAGNRMIVVSPSGKPVKGRMIRRERREAKPLT